MTPEQVQLVQQTWSRLAPDKAGAGMLFYDRLFAQHPELQPMFKGDRRTQALKLMNMIDVAVNALNDLGAVVPDIEVMGRRHLNYGVEPEHYAQVGAVLLWTLQQGLGEQYTPEVEGAWTTVYGVLADTMQRGAYENMPG